MKHVSRVLFGLSIAAVLSLVTACSQANDTKSSQGIPAALTNPKAETGANPKEITLKADKVAQSDYTEAKITAKENGAGADVSFAIGSGSEATSHTVAKDTLESAVKSGVTFVMPKAKANYTFTIELLKKAGAKSTVVAKTLVKGTSKEEAQSGNKPTAESLGKLAKEAEVAAAVTAALTAGSENASAVTKGFTITAPSDPKFAGVTFAWSSDNAAISFANNVATVKRPAKTENDVACKISVTLTKDNVSSGAVEVITLTVKKEEAQGGNKPTADDLKALAKNAAVKKAITDALATANETADAVTKAFTITEPAAGEFSGVTFAWSSDKDAISFAGNKATVKRPAKTENDVACKISVTLTKDNVSSGAVEVITLTVKKEEAQGGNTPTPDSLKALVTTDNEAKQLVVAAITKAITDGGDKKDSVTKNFTIAPPADGKFAGVTFTWSSDKTAISFSGNTATVARPKSSEADAECKISVKLSSGSVEMAAPVEVFTLTVKKEEAQGGNTPTPDSLKALVTTDNEAKQLVVAAITKAITDGGDKKDSVTKNFTIAPPADGKFAGVTFTWSSDKTAVSFSGNTATVARPKSSEADAECKISVKLSSGSVEMAAPVEVFTLTVKKQE